MEARYKLERYVQELKEQIRTDGAQRSAVSKEAEVVKREIDAKRTQLANQILPALRQAEQTHDQVTRNVQECRAQSEHLIAKQSRKSQFHTQQQRDDYLHRELGAPQGVRHGIVVVLHGGLGAVKEEFTRWRTCLAEHNGV
jgi:structural maintenance of chromosome 3 (chondroitin sulfate proteoglycan 6)